MDLLDHHAVLPRLTILRPKLATALDVALPALDTLFGSLTAAFTEEAVKPRTDNFWMCFFKRLGCLQRSSAMGSLSRPSDCQ
jgi:hypothetical protein